MTLFAPMCWSAPRGKPLIVDEEWGAHLPFHEDLPTWAMDVGADVSTAARRTGEADRGSARVRRPAAGRFPGLDGSELETVVLPRDAFFGPVEDVPAREAVGRIAAEQITPYPPGIPVVLPSKQLNEAVLDYLLSGVGAGMVLPD